MIKMNFISHRWFVHTEDNWWFHSSLIFRSSSSSLFSSLLSSFLQPTYFHFASQSTTSACSLTTSFTTSPLSLCSFTKSSLLLVIFFFIVNHLLLSSSFLTSFLLPYRRSPRHPGYRYSNRIGGRSERCGLREIPCWGGEFEESSWRGASDVMYVSLPLSLSHSHTMSVQLSLTHRRRGTLNSSVSSVHPLRICSKSWERDPRPAKQLRRRRSPGMFGWIYRWQKREVEMKKQGERKKGGTDSEKGIGGNWERERNSEGRTREGEGETGIKGEKQMITIIEILIVLIVLIVLIDFDFRLYIVSYFVLNSKGTRGLPTTVTFLNFFHPPISLSSSFSVALALSTSLYLSLYASFCL